MTQNDSLYNRIGGEAAVSVTAGIFYRKVLNDDRIKEFFDDTEMEAQIAKQKSFLTMVFGGPNNYTGKDLRTAHAPLVKRGMGRRQRPRVPRRPHIGPAPCLLLRHSRGGRARRFAHTRPQT